MLPDIKSYKNVFCYLLTAPKVKILLDLCQSFFCATGRVTTRSLSRYSSYGLRQLFRFLGAGNMNWIKLRVALFKSRIYDKAKEFVLCFDETVEGKSGKSTYGVERFFSGVEKRAIRSVKFMVSSLLDISDRASYPVGVEQVVYSEQDIARIAEEKLLKKQAHERQLSGKAKPRGAKRKKDKQTEDSNKEQKQTHGVCFRVFSSLLEQVHKELVAAGIQVKYLAADTGFSGAHYFAETLRRGLHLITKLPINAAFYERYQGGGKRKYGDRLDKDHLDESKLAASFEHEYQGKKCRIELYQYKNMLSKNSAQTALNLVLAVAVDEKGAKAFVTLASTDMELSAKKMWDIYGCRFQIEFNFRDAKQHFGLSDFKNYKQNNVSNFVNMSFFMVLLSEIMLKEAKKKNPNFNWSVSDIKIYYHARFQCQSLINWARKRGISNLSEVNIDEFMPTDIVNAA